MYWEDYNYGISDDFEPESDCDPSNDTNDPSFDPGQGTDAGRSFEGEVDTLLATMVMIPPPL